MLPQRTRSVSPSHAAPLGGRNGPAPRRPGLDSHRGARVTPSLGARPEGLDRERRHRTLSDRSAGAAASAPSGTARGHRGSANRPTAPPPRGPTWLRQPPPGPRKAQAGRPAVLSAARGPAAPLPLAAWPHGAAPLLWVSFLRQRPSWGPANPARRGRGRGSQGLRDGTGRPLGFPKGRPPGSPCFLPVSCPFYQQGVND